MRTRGGFITLTMLGAGNLFGSAIAYANCSPPGTSGPDVIICDASAPDPFVPGGGQLSSGGGNDTFNLIGGTVTGHISGVGGAPTRSTSTERP